MIQDWWRFTEHFEPLVRDFSNEEKRIKMIYFLTLEHM